MSDIETGAGVLRGGIATGVGSWPGTESREAAATVVGELGELPHLVELPGRGVGADMVGRVSALLVDMRFDSTTRGYRLAVRPGRWRGGRAISCTRISMRSKRLGRQPVSWDPVGRSRFRSPGR